MWLSNAKIAPKEKPNDYVYALKSTLTGEVWFKTGEL